MADLEAAVRVGDDFDGRHLHAALGALALQKLGLLIVNVNLKLLLHIIIHMHQPLDQSQLRVLSNFYIGN
jgi:uncharacterized membrane protein